MLNRCGNKPLYKNIEVEISEESFVQWFINIETCAVCGDSLNNSPFAVDRIDPNKHYSKNNIQALCPHCHKIKTLIQTLKNCIVNDPRTPMLFNSLLNKMDVII